MWWQQVVALVIYGFVVLGVATARTVRSL
jgi:hypothetical protein